MRIVRIVLGLFACLAMSAPVFAGRPLEQIKTSADKIIAVLNDVAQKGDAKKTERRRRIRQELDERFDWAGIARGCLGRHWAKRSRDEQREFVDLFGRFLEQTYLDKIEP